MCRYVCVGLRVSTMYEYEHVGYCVSLECMDMYVRHRLGYERMVWWMFGQERTVWIKRLLMSMNVWVSVYSWMLIDICMCYNISIVHVHDYMGLLMSLNAWLWTYMDYAYWRTYWYIFKAYRRLEMQTTKKKTRLNTSPCTKQNKTKQKTKWQNPWTHKHKPTTHRSWV